MRGKGKQISQPVVLAAVRIASECLSQPRYFAIVTPAVLTTQPPTAKGQGAKKYTTLDHQIRRRRAASAAAGGSLAASEATETSRIGQVHKASGVCGGFTEL